MIELKGVGSTKSTNLSIEIIKTLRKYDLNLNQVIAVTSDNGANMLKTTSLLSKCLTKFQEEEFLDNDNYQQLLEEIENDCDIDMGDITICRYISLNKEYVTKSSNSIEENNGGEEEDILTAFLRQDVIQGCDINIYTKIERLMLHFETSDCCVLDYWNKRKSLDEELFILSNIIFGVPPTQVTIERAFSSLRIILSESRNRLSPETLENILLVKLNPALLDEAIGNLAYLIKLVLKYLQKSWILLQ
ncbi:uncharacterized protein LOC124419016 [Lucilia cuprina]|uniref:uncharacterized protein LOC124419016 n=1 Tax=Lucilia cuprina TaxID=7375 RepID=UPI001F050D76|nr:uncharacterized protein LOC124419016 [Lucilia cuprina]